VCVVDVQQKEKEKEEEEQEGTNKQGRMHHGLDLDKQASNEEERRSEATSERKGLNETSKPAPALQATPQFSLTHYHAPTQAWASPFIPSLAQHHHPTTSQPASMAAFF